MDNSLLNDENTPRHNVLQNEKRKPLESPFSAFSPAQRLAKKKGRILCEPGDSNLEASMMEESILHAELSDAMKLPNTMRPKVLFAEGDGDIETDESGYGLDETTVDPTQVDGDRTFSIETRPFIPAAVDPNLDETYADMSMNQTFSNMVRPVVSSSIDPNLDETLAETTMNETFTDVVRPVAPSSIDPNLDETLAETTINETQLSADESMFVMASHEDDFDDADRTLGEAEGEVVDKEGSSPSIFHELNRKQDATKVDEEKEESSGLTNMENRGGVSLFEEMNTIQLIVPVDLCVKDEEESAVEASQENSLMKEGGEAKEVSLFDELNSQSSRVWMDEEKEENEAELSINKSPIQNEGLPFFDDMNGMMDDCGMDESVLSTITAMEMTNGQAHRLFYNNMKQRLSQMNISVAPDMASPVSTEATINGRLTLSNTILESPGTPCRSSRYNNMNDSHISFLVHEAEATSSVYNELRREMEGLQEELIKAREHTERVERERDNAKKEADDYVFVMEMQKKKMMGEKSDLTKQLFDLENELSEARRMSSVVEEEGRKVEEMERMKMELEEQKKGLEEKIMEESEKYAIEKERLSRKADEMERLIEEERKKANEEMERRLVECRGDMERRIEEILMQKNELITQLEKMECESGDKEYTNEETERRLEGDKAMMETMMANVMREKKEIEGELEKVKVEKDEAIRKMNEVGAECEGIKNACADFEEWRKVAFEESRIKNAELEELKKSHDDAENKFAEEKATIETVMANLMTEKKEIEDELKKVKVEKDEAIRKMNEVGAECEGIKNVCADFEELKKVAFEESRITNAELEELKKSNEELKIEMEEMQKGLNEMRKGIEEKDKEIVSLQSTIALFTKSEGRMGEMEDKVKELEKEKKELEMSVKGMEMEKEMSGKMQTQLEEMMNGLRKNEEHLKEKTALQEEMIELKRKIMETEVEMKTKEKELEASEKMRKGMEEEMEKIKGEAREKIESMELTNNSVKKELDETRNLLKTANEETARMESMVRGIEEDSTKRMNEMEREKEMQMKEILMEMERMKGLITELNDGKTMMEGELEKKNEEIGMAMREIETEKKKTVTISQMEDALKNEMEESRQRVVRAESALTLMTTEKEEMERRVIEENGQKEEIMRMMEEVRKEKEEMERRMETMQKEIEMEKESSSHQLSETLKNVQMQLENEREEKKMISLRLNEIEKEKIEAEKRIDAERERNDILSATVKQLEDEVDRVGVNGMSGGIDEEDMKKMEEELKEEKETVMRLKKEVKRLEETCDEFDDIEWKLKEELVAKQKKIDTLEGKTTNAGPSLLDALKPTNTEIKSMNETVVIAKQSSPSPAREVAGKEEKEDEDMKEEYGTPSGSMMEEEDRKEEMMNGDETLGVTKMDATRFDVDEEDYERANQTRPNASCRQS